VNEWNKVEKTKPKNKSFGKTLSDSFNGWEIRNKKFGSRRRPFCTKNKRRVRKISSYYLSDCHLCWGQIFIFFSFSFFFLFNFFVGFLWVVHKVSYFAFASSNNWDIRASKVAWWVPFVDILCDPRRWSRKLKRNNISHYIVIIIWKIKMNKDVNRVPIVSYFQVQLG